jgi:hypothetical protein
MDAVSFVMGLSARALRGKSLADLIWSGGTAKSATVTLVYVVDDGEVEGLAAGDELTFARHVVASGSSSYRFNGREVTADAYAAHLEAIHVSLKAQNFLVFQVRAAGVSQRGRKRASRMPPPRRRRRAHGRRWQAVRLRFCSRCSPQRVAAVGGRTHVWDARHGAVPRSWQVLRNPRCDELKRKLHRLGPGPSVM